MPFNLVFACYKEPSSAACKDYIMSDTEMEAG